MRIGFIGIGAMGEPMAANLLKKGFDLTVLRHRRPEPAARLQGLGAKVAHVCEDMVLAQDMAASGSAPVFMFSAAQGIYRLLELRGEGARDMSAVAELWPTAGLRKD